MNLTLPLLLGIKRSVFRSRDKVRERERADAELAAKRPGTLQKQEYKCRGCGYESKDTGIGAKRKPSFLDVHHLDDNHQNNEDSNLALACHTCHPYQHIGELASRVDAPISAEGLGKKTMIASIPEVSPSDLNLLQRALGVALHDPDEAKFALQIIDALSNRSDRVKQEFGTESPLDFAAAMSQLKSGEYDVREDAIEDLRVLFHPATLKVLGSEMMQDFPTLPIKSWPNIATGVARKSE